MYTECKIGDEVELSSLFEIIVFFKSKDFSDNIVKSFNKIYGKHKLTAFKEVECTRLVLDCNKCHDVYYVRDKFEKEIKDYENDIDHMIIQNY